MKGDFSRLTFDPTKHYSSVRLQQGRVQLDADWNEQVDITEHRIGTLFTDLIGQSGAPRRRENSGFQITVKQNEITIGAGRMYVAGMLCENEAPVLYTKERCTQPDPVSQMAPGHMSCPSAQPDLPGAKLPTENGSYLAYLDVWQQLITVLEDPDIREPALGGADTAVRTKNVWQAKLLKVTDGVTVDTGAQALAAIEKEHPKISNGTMSFQMISMVSPVENQLYRVEIHTPGAPDTATFKWSRDNGTIAFRVKSFQCNTITLANEGADPQTRFAPNQWIELSDEEHTLNGQPGFLATVDTIQDRSLTVQWKEPPAPKQREDKSYIVRCWDVCDKHTQNNSGAELEHGIKITFTGERFKTGDYWLIPVRTGQQPDGQGQPQQPHGIQHHYVPLAKLRRSEGKWTDVVDLRPTFSALTEGLLSKSGDTMTGPLSMDGDNTLEFGAGVSGKEFNAGKIGYKTFTKDTEGTEGALDIVGAGATVESRKIKLWAEGGATVEGGVSITGNVGIGTDKPTANPGNLTVTGTVAATTFTGESAVFTGLTLAESGMSLQGPLTVTGATTLHDPVTVQGNLSVTVNVGIGIANPGEKLHVSGGKIQLDGNQQIKFTDIDTTKNLKVQLWSGYGLGINEGTLFYAGGRHSWRDSYGATESMALTTGADGGLTVTGTGNSSFVGNVGIGTTSPEAKLEINSTIVTHGGWYEAIRFSQPSHSAITHPGGGLLFGLHSDRHFYFADIKDGLQKYVMTINGATGNVVVEGDVKVNGRIRDKTGCVMPVGTILPYAGTPAPEGWLLCDGKPYSSTETTYQDLFNVIRFTYGGENDTFLVPNLCGRGLMGYSGTGSFAALGLTGGAEAHTLTIEEMPPHTHSVNDLGHSHNFKRPKGDQDWSSGSKNAWWGNNEDGEVNLGPDKTNISIEQAGKGQPHSILDPYLTINFIIKY